MPDALIDQALAVAGSAPSGANLKKPFLLIPVGFPAPNAVVPANTKKTLEAIRINR